MKSKRRITTYSRGEAIYRQEDEAKELFLLSRGRVELSHLTADGKRLKLAMIRPGRFFGEVAPPEGAIYFATAEAVEAAQVVVLGREEAEQLIRKRPRLALQFIKELNRQLVLSQLRLVALAYYNVPTRIAVELVRLSQEEQTTNLSLTHQALGEAVGLMRESVTRTLHMFEKAGLVELYRGRMFLRDVSGLHMLLRSNGINAFFPLTNEPL